LNKSICEKCGKLTFDSLESTHANIYLARGGNPVCICILFIPSRKFVRDSFPRCPTNARDMTHPKDQQPPKIISQHHHKFCHNTTHTITFPLQFQNGRLTTPQNPSSALPSLPPPPPTPNTSPKLLPTTTISHSRALPLRRRRNQRRSTTNTHHAQSTKR